MTALAGCWNYGGKPHPDESCKRMLAAQAMYGPHGERYWSDGSLAMGRRLFATLPEDACDRQPLHAADGRLTLVADVRLDNRDELSAALGWSADRARGLCDAAMLLACLERWGQGALDRLAGDFAFALWDAAGQELLLARDFIGQRPLHFHRGSGFFAFASMPKGLHALPDIPYAADEQAMAEFITLIPVGGTRSFFAGIETIAAGEVATVTPRGISRRRYWRPERAPVRSGRADDYVEGLRHHLDQATQSRLRGANGAVACHLSAGFDSASVAATAARLMAPQGGKVVGFTAVPREGYDRPDPKNRLGDEGPTAAETAALHPNIEHVLVRSGHRSPLADLDRNALLYDRPMLNPCNSVWVSAINDEARRRKLKVLLTGQMGNMTISYAGNERLAELARSGRFVELRREGAHLVARRTMRWRGVLAAAFGPFVPERLWQWLSRLRDRKYEITEYTAVRPERLQELDLARLASERGLDFAYRPRKNGHDTRVWAMRRVDFGNLNKGILAGWGIDQRDPTADRRLVEFCLSAPMDQYLRLGERRSLGRRALSDRLPATVLDSRRKGYQGADWHEGLTAARADLEAEVDRLALCEPAARALDVERMQRLVADWPEAGWERLDVISTYRMALLRGVSAGHFLRRATGSNQ
ncbi:MAG TPA: asparagine synthase-related protein [Croceibacterium sp.]